MDSRSSIVRKPLWLKREMAFHGKQAKVRRCLSENGLHTVCDEARCPNRSECFAKGTATFLVMGDICTRNCAFCSVKKGQTLPIDWSEVSRVVDAVKKMHLKHVVITSVTRDDLDDGGAHFFSQLVEAFRHSLSGVSIELLIPDLQGDDAALETVFKSRPDIVNHNIETVPSLYNQMRPQADYKRSLKVINKAANFDLITKSGIMVGLGEKPEEVCAVMDDLFSSGCTIVTIGQYMQPSSKQTPVKEFISPETFSYYREYGLEKGFIEVASGPFVRSSYHAAESMNKAKAKAQSK